jgi:hypothetical protein
MKKSLVEIYAMSICFVMVIVFCFSFVSAVVNFVEYHNPTMALPDYYIEKYSSNEAYTRNWAKDKRAKYTDDEITAQREAARESALSAEKLGAKQDILEAVVTLFVSAIFFVIHWILAARWRAKTT